LDNVDNKQKFGMIMGIYQTTCPNNLILCISLYDITTWIPNSNYYKYEDTKIKKIISLKNYIGEHYCFDNSINIMYLD